LTKVYSQLAKIVTTKAAAGDHEIELSKIGEMLDEILLMVHGEV
jgi:hypothetical protein